MVIIADDLTGASDSAIQFGKKGLKAVVLPRLDNNLLKDIDHFAAYDVLSISTNTRTADPETAYSTLSSVCKTLGSIKLFKKVDSALRGNPGLETVAILNCTGLKKAFIAPSYPAYDRIIEDGVLRTPTKSLDAQACLAKNIDDEVISVPLSTVRSGSEAIRAFTEDHESRLFVFDAVTNEDLNCVYEAAQEDESILLCGSAGLAESAAKDLGKCTSHKNPDLSLIKSMLFTIGSVSRITATQVMVLQKAFEPHMAVLNTSLINEQTKACVIEDLLSCSQDLRLLVTDSLLHRPNLSDFYSAENLSKADEISDMLGAITSSVVRSASIDLVFACGGDTALKICQALEVEGLESLDELAFGIPISRIIGGAADGKYMVTKSGGFGFDDTLVKLVKAISGGER